MPPLVYTSSKPSCFTASLGFSMLPRRRTSVVALSLFAMACAASQAVASDRTRLPIAPGVYGPEASFGVPNCGKGAGAVEFTAAGIRRDGRQMCRWISVEVLEPDQEAKAAIAAIPAEERDPLEGVTFEATADCPGEDPEPITFILSPRTKPIPNVTISEDDNPETFYLCRPAK